MYIIKEATGRDTILVVGGRTSENRCEGKTFQTEGKFAD
jgi:hypothetical protein